MQFRIILANNNITSATFGVSVFTSIDERRGEKSVPAIFSTFFKLQQWWLVNRVFDTLYLVRSTMKRENTKNGKERRRSLHQMKMYNIFTGARQLSY